eukprot:scaffold170163_cov14-Prasinocladus_malaysianus.AAC.1
MTSQSDRRRREVASDKTIRRHVQLAMQREELVVRMMFPAEQRRSLCRRPPRPAASRCGACIAAPSRERPCRLLRTPPPYSQGWTAGFRTQLGFRALRACPDAT